jgi:hypothetical protein
MGGRTENQIKNRYFWRLLKIHREKANQDISTDHQLEKLAN